MSKVHLVYQIPFILSMQQLPWRIKSVYSGNRTNQEQEEQGAQDSSA